MTKYTVICREAGESSPHLNALSGPIGSNIMKKLVSLAACAQTFPALADIAPPMVGLLSSVLPIALVVEVLGIVIILAKIRIRKVWKVLIFMMIAIVWCCFPFPILRSVMPLLGPVIEKSKYEASPIPTLGFLRAQIGTYQREKGYLPGLQVRSDGMNIASDDQSLGVQTFVEDSRHGWLPAVGGLKCGETVPVWHDAVGVQWKPDMRADWTSPKNHFAEHLSISEYDLKGGMQPNQVQYRVLSGGYKSNAYAYAIGVFGDGNRLAAGTGCAIIEIVNPTAGVKVVGFWERYKPKGGEQVVLCTAGESGVADGLQTKDKNICWLGDPTCYLSTDVATVQKAIEQLKRAGWDFDSEKWDENWKRSGLK